MGRKNKRIPERYLPLPRIGSKDPAQHLQEIIDQSNKKAPKE